MRKKNLETQKNSLLDLRPQEFTVFNKCGTTEKGWKKGNERVCVIERECAVCVSDKKDRERMCACVREKECVCETREYL